MLLDFGGTSWVVCKFTDIVLASTNLICWLKSGFVTARNQDILQPAIKLMSLFDFGSSHEWAICWVNENFPSPLHTKLFPLPSAENVSTLLWKTVFPLEKLGLLFLRGGSTHISHRCDRLFPQARRPDLVGSIKTFRRPGKYYRLPDLLAFASWSAVLCSSNLYVHAISPCDVTKEEHRAESLLPRKKLKKPCFATYIFQIPSFL